MSKELVHESDWKRRAEWTAVARGAVRVSSTSLSGKQITLTYVEPGVWFGDVAMFDGDQRTHDAYAHGPTTLLCVARSGRWAPPP